MECENCFSTDETKNYQWANISGDYKKDLSDWARLCASCHTIIDQAEFGKGETHSRWLGDYCGRGHLMKGHNLFYKPRKHGMVRNCRACHYLGCARYKARKRAALAEQKAKP